MDKHFPEIRWRRQNSWALGPLIFFGLFALGAFGFTFLTPDIWGKLLLGGPGIALFVLIAWGTWRTRNDEIVLTAEGIKGPRWKRALRFTDVEKINLKRIFLAKTGTTFFEMTFIFKIPQKALTTWYVRNSCESICLHIGTGMSEKPDIMLQTIYRYYRHELPPAPEVRNEEFSVKDFPEKRWKNKGNSPPFTIGISCLIALFLFFVIVSPDTGGRVVSGVIVLLFGLVALFMWKTRNEELILTADGVIASRWKRPLHFADVETIEIQRSYTVINTNVLLKFNFKTRQRSFSDWSPTNSCMDVVLGLDPRLGETEVIAQTIYRYFVRQPLD